MNTSTLKDRKKYVPENPTFYKDLRTRCLTALERQSDPGTDPSFQNVYGRLQGLGLVVRAGFIPQVIMCGMYNDIIQIEKELGKLHDTYLTEPRKHRLQILIQELRGLDLTSMRPEPR